MGDRSIRLLLQGIDTLQCAYYLKPVNKPGIDFKRLAIEKELLRASKRKDPLPITLGNSQFLLQPSGSGSGYPFILRNEFFRIECGEFNTPNFFVTFQSQGLWQESAFCLHERFLKWAASVGYTTGAPERVSRVDFSFDYNLPVVDFDENCFVTRSKKDSRIRENRKVQTYTLGQSDIRLRIYDKVAEIRQKSDKVWFFLLWDQDEDVWRIEWQVRKEVLRQFGIETFDQLKVNQGALLKYLAEEHTTLRSTSTDSNVSRWPVHPLWQDLQKQIEKINSQTVNRVYGKNAAIDERELRMSISVLGYLKRYAAIHCVKRGIGKIDLWETINHLRLHLHKIYDPMSWEIDVDRRIKEIERGKW